MGVRVRVRIVIGDKVIETTALVNSGFETETPQLLVPHKFILSNNIDLNILEKPRIQEYDTAGGPIIMYIYPEACTINVIEEDRASKNVKADLVISPIEKEVLMSDALTEELEIIIMSPKRGLWKFADDPQNKIRQSHKPKYW
jgi:hypothetical protein